MSPEPWNDARTRLVAAGFGVPIEWPNEQFVEPDPSAGPWLSIESTGDIGVPIEIGPGVWQESGRLFVHIVAPAFSGSDAARALAKQVANTFRGLGPNNTRYTAAAIGSGQVNTEQGVVWVLTVTIEYHYQDRTTAA